MLDTCVGSAATAWASRSQPAPVEYAPRQVRRAAMRCIACCTSCTWEAPGWLAVESASVERPASRRGHSPGWWPCRRAEEGRIINSRTLLCVDWRCGAATLLRWAARVVRACAPASFHDGWALTELYAAGDRCVLRLSADGAKGPTADAAVARSFDRKSDQSKDGLCAQPAAG